jgi:hypothetical protein
VVGWMIGAARVVHNPPLMGIDHLVR